MVSLVLLTSRNRFAARGWPAYSLTALRSVFTSVGEISLGSLLRQVSQEG